MRLGICLATIAVLMEITSASGAEIKQGYSYDEIVSQGPIAKGDNSKLFNLFFDGAATSVYLASPGGDMGEAMRMGELIRELKLTTVVLSSAVSCSEGESTVDIDAEIADGVSASYDRAARLCHGGRRKNETSLEGIDDENRFGSLNDCPHFVGLCG